MKRIAVIRIRGSIGVKGDIKDTLAMLRLKNKNSCVIIKNSPAHVGMLRKVKDYVTWGEIDEKTMFQLLKVRGKIVGSKNLSEEYLREKLKSSIEGFTKEFFEFRKELKDIPGLKLYFRLKPPTGGFERKGVKYPFSLGGVLGYRKDKINNMIIKML
ncbi:50S ribosomal protein L30 [Candidatus Woesearchaeota archaeon]|nr:50S ribosomal protein L30 [Candidatus Woesearchaeota archaeon]